jgi:hypothetical protein
LGCSALTSITLPGSLTSIGESAFANCSILTNITLPASLTAIAQSAFQGCSSFTEFIVDPSNVHFQVSEGVLFDYSFRTLVSYPAANTRTQYTISNQITLLYNSAFSGCANLINITLPTNQNFTTISSRAFDGCTSLQDITFPSNISGIGSFAFSNCSSLSSIALPSLLTAIAVGAFERCEKLENVTFPLDSTLTTISGQAFSSCSSLKNINLPATLINIGSEAFYYCSSLTTLTLPASLKIIGLDAFAGCSALTDFFVDSENSAFKQVDGVLFDYSGTTLIACPTGNSRIDYTVAEGIQTIGTSAFQYCNNLKRITLANSVTSVNPKAFNGCQKLLNVEFPEGIQIISSRTFAYCYSFTNITLPSNIRVVSNGAFSTCINLESITFPDKLSLIEFQAFVSCVKLKNIYFFGNIPFIAPPDAFKYITSSNSVYYVNDSTNFKSLNTIFNNVIWLKYITEIKVSDIKNTSATINWNPVANVQKGTFTGKMNYIAIIRPKALSSARSYSSGNSYTISNATSYTFSNLTPNTEYSYTLRYSINDVFLDEISGNFTTTGIISPICFIGTTRINTDQGILEIKNIVSGKNTIQGKEIIAITKTSYPFSTLLKIEKNALAKNVPSEPVTLTPSHKVYYQGRWMKAYELQNRLGKEKIQNVNYKGEVLYNILMKKHESVLASNLIVETLHPRNIIACLYKNKNYEKASSEKKNKLIENVNSFSKKALKVALVESRL